MLRTLFPALPDTHFKVWSFNRVVIFKHLLKPDEADQNDSSNPHRKINCDGEFECL